MFRAMENHGGSVFVLSGEWDGFPVEKDGSGCKEVTNWRGPDGSRTQSPPLPSIGLSAPTLPFPADLGTPISAKHPDQCGLRCQLSHQDLRAHLRPEAKLEVRSQTGALGSGWERGRG